MRVYQESRVLICRTEQRGPWANAADAGLAARESMALGQSRAVFERATEPGAQDRPRAPDAVHLPTAIEAQGDPFSTNEKRLTAAAAGRSQVRSFQA
jgi:hypothetical protein